jgi:hypothetical protein
MTGFGKQVVTSRRLMLGSNGRSREAEMELFNLLDLRVPLARAQAAAAQAAGGQGAETEGFDLSLIDASTGDAEADSEAEVESALPELAEAADPRPEAETTAQGAFFVSLILPVPNGEAPAIAQQWVSQIAAPLNLTAADMALVSDESALLQDAAFGAAKVPNTPSAGHLVRENPENLAIGAELGHHSKAHRTMRATPPEGLATLTPQVDGFLPSARAPLADAPAGKHTAPPVPHQIGTMELVPIVQKAAPLAQPTPPELSVESLQTVTQVPAAPLGQLGKTFAASAGATAPLDFFTSEAAEAIQTVPFDQNARLILRGDVPKFPASQQAAYELRLIGQDPDCTALPPSGERIEARATFAAQAASTLPPGAGPKADTPATVFLLPLLAQIPHVDGPLQRPSAVNVEVTALTPPSAERPKAKIGLGADVSLLALAEPVLIGIDGPAGADGALRPEGLMPLAALHKAPDGAAPAIAPAALTHQIARTILITAEDRAELLLEPAELGRLRFEILQRGDGVQILISAERPETMDLLRRNANQLLSELSAMGLEGSELGFGRWAEGRPEDQRRQLLEPEPGGYAAFGGVENFASPQTQRQRDSGLDLRL